MFIKDGIVYAGEPDKLLSVTKITALDNYRLLVFFNNDEKRIFDFSSILNQPAYKPLRDPAVFSNVNIDHGIPIWNEGDIDISPEYLYEYGMVTENA